MIIAPALLIAGVLSSPSQQLVLAPRIQINSTEMRELHQESSRSASGIGRPNIRGGLLTFFSRRNATLAGEVGSASGLHPGVELSMWWPEFLGSPQDGARSFLGVTDIGVYGRMLGGGYSAEPEQELAGPEAVGEVNNADVELHLGRRVLHARAGYGLRSFTGALGTVRWSFLRLGARSSFFLGNSREFEVTLGAVIYVGANGGSGREGESRLTFVPQCSSRSDVTTWICNRIFAVLAYRFEQFTAKAAPDAGGNRPEEIGSVVIGLGIR